MDLDYYCDSLGDWMIETIVKAFGGLVFSLGWLFLIVILGTLIGGVIGWTVGLVFDDTLAALKTALGLSVTNFQLGAMLGFVGGFFKSSKFSTETKGK